MGLSKYQTKNLKKQRIRMSRMITDKLNGKIDIEWNQMADILGVSNITLLNFRIKNFPESVKKYIR